MKTYNNQLTITNVRKAHCRHCGCELEAGRGHYIYVPKAGYAYMCRDCFTEMLSYGAESVEKIGKPKRCPVTTGVELEIPHGYDNQQYDALRVLRDSGWIPSHDCTVSIEYKSPIFYNLNHFPKQLRSVMEENGIELNPHGEAGTHINVWCDWLDSDDFMRIRDWYNVLFSDMYEFFKENRSKCRKLFGREMNIWCRMFDVNEHACFINMEECKRNAPRIEFRCALYANNGQYMRCLHFANDVMEVIAKDFILGKHSNATNAQLASAKIMKLVEKYTKD